MEDVDPPVVAAARADGVDDVLLAGYVGSNGERLTAFAENEIGGLLRGLQVLINDRDVRPVTTEGESDGTSVAGVLAWKLASSNYERHPFLESPGTRMNVAAADLTYNI
jgi:hypothetical protein